MSDPALRAEVEALRDALTEILAGGVEFDDVRLHYVTMQIDRADLDAARAALESVPRLLDRLAEGKGLGLRAIVEELADIDCGEAPADEECGECLVCRARAALAARPHPTQEAT